MSAAESILTTALQAGWQLWVEGERVRYRRPANSPDRLLQQLREHKEALRPLLPQKRPNQTRVFRFRLAGGRGWATLIAPGWGLTEARQELETRFGDRLLEVAER